ncbi:MAG: 50S ribosomal protein L19 [uncultured bacterium]|nr:MAG: 50S ribosomal protein L19 [uncultured bacterium]
MNKLVEKIENEQLRKIQIPELEIGSTIKIAVKFEEEGKERSQAFTGTLIAKKGSGIRKTITLRRVTGNYEIERHFFLNSPLIAKIEVIKKNKVRKAKLYYLRDKVGKAAKLTEKD